MPLGKCLWKVGLYSSIQVLSADQKKSTDFRMAWRYDFNLAIGSDALVLLTNKFTNKLRSTDNLCDIFASHLTVFFFPYSPVQIPRYYGCGISIFLKDLMCIIVSPELLYVQHTNAWCLEMPEEGASLS